MIGGGGRSRSRGSGSGGSLVRHLVIAIIVIAMASLVVQSSAFDALQGSRTSDIGVAGDGNGLIGIDLPPNVPVGGSGAASCSFGSNAVRLSHGHSEDVETDSDVIVTGSVEADIDTDGCVRAESGSRVDGDVDAGGTVTLKPGSRIDGAVEAGDGVRVGDSGSRIHGDVSTDGDVDVQSGGRIDGNVDAGGDVSVDSGARIEGDVTAGGTVTVESGGRIEGDVEEGTGSSPSYPRLVTLTNNLGDSVEVTVSLLDGADGTLVEDGESEGDTLTFVLSPEERRAVSIDPESSGGTSIEFRVIAVSSSDGSTIRLDRTVEKRIITEDAPGPANGGDDDSDDNRGRSGDGDGGEEDDGDGGEEDDGDGGGRGNGNGGGPG